MASMTTALASSALLGFFAGLAPDPMLALVMPAKLAALNPHLSVKAAFFLRFGFSAADWPQLAAAILRLAQENEVAETSRPDMAGGTSWTGACLRPMAQA